MPDLKTGKREATHDHRDITLAAIDHQVAAQLQKPPARFGIGNKFSDWGMLGNDAWGDCVLAGAGHEHMGFAVTAGGEARFDDEAALRGYAAITGGGPYGDGSDPGTYVRDAMKYRKSHGIKDADGTVHKIAAYVSIDPHDPDLLMLAAWNFLAVGMGFEFPDTAMDQFNAGEPWDVVRGAQIEGGHYVVVTGRTGADDLGVITWAKRQGMTRDFYSTYNDETWALVSEDELKNGRTVRGYDLSGLQTALKEL